MAIDSKFIGEIGQNVILPLMEIADQLGMDECKNLHINVSNQLQDLDIALVGIYSSGKSTVLNTLFALDKGQKLPVKRLPTTMRMWRLEYGPKTSIQAKSQEGKVVRTFEMPTLKQLGPDDPIFADIDYFDANVDSLFLEHHKELIFWDTEGLNAPEGKGLNDQDFAKIRDSEILVWVCDNKPTKTGIDAFRKVCRNNPFAMVFVIMTNAEGREPQEFHAHKNLWINKWREELQDVVCKDIHYLTLECKQAQAAIAKAFKVLPKGDQLHLLLGDVNGRKLPAEIQQEMSESGVLALWGFFREIRNREKAIKAMSLQKKLSSTIHKLQEHLEQDLIKTKKTISDITTEADVYSAKIEVLPELVDKDDIHKITGCILEETLISQKTYLHQTINSKMDIIREGATQLNPLEMIDNFSRNFGKTIFSFNPFNPFAEFGRIDREIIIRKRWEIAGGLFETTITEIKEKFKNQLPKIAESSLTTEFSKIFRKSKDLASAREIDPQSVSFNTAFDTMELNRNIRKWIKNVDLGTIDISQYGLIESDSSNPKNIDALAENIFQTLKNSNDYGKIESEIHLLLKNKIKKMQKLFNQEIRKKKKEFLRKHQLEQNPLERKIENISEKLKRLEFAKKYIEQITKEI